MAKRKQPNFKNKPKTRTSFIKFKQLKEDPRKRLYDQLMQCDARVKDLRAMNGRTAVDYVTPDSGGGSVSKHPLDNFQFDLESL